MNRDADGKWPQTGTLAALGSNSGEGLDDFVNFDNFESLDFGFDIDHNVNSAGALAGLQAVADNVDDENGASGDRTWQATDEGASYGPDMQNYDGDGHGHLMGSYHSAPNLLQRMSIDQMSVDNDAYHGRPQVPPTPNSSGFYAQTRQLPHDFSDITKHNGGSFQFPPEQTFTPIFTPDSTAPHSAVSVVPDYAVSHGFDLSPLTSPAMFAQQQRDGYHLQHLHTADSSLAASPVSGSFGDFARAPEERPRKTRKKDVNSAATTPLVKPKQPSKSMANRRRGSLTIPTNSKASRKAPSEPQSAIELGSSGLHTAPHSPHGSTTQSISPRPLAESLMAPPPKPVTPAGTPRVNALDKQHQKQGQAPPATPASLMKMPQQRALAEKPTPKPQESADAASPPIGPMEFLSLPEAAAPVPATDQKQGAQVAPKLPLPRANTSKGTPGSASPALNGSNTPAAAANSSSRGSKKRNSTSSNLISPALRPKISPSIRPMLPAGSSSLTPSAQELLLASKSNYQNLLEGNAVPGVTYPSELATNLTSKRTSHKIAEQGRRNRINTALQEMQSLLPAQMSAAAAKDEPLDGKSPAAVAAAALPNEKTSPPPPCTPGAATDKKASPGGNSKAATVELAIEYIRQLKNESDCKDAEIERLKVQMAKLQAVAATSGAETDMNSTEPTEQDTTSVA